MAEKLSVSEIREFAKEVVESGEFPEIRNASQAFIRIQAGQELGFPPLASIQGISFSRGQRIVRSHMVAALIQSNREYDYRKLEHTDESCSIEFFKVNGSGAQHSLGISTFTMADAKRAGLLDKKDRNGRPIVGPWQQHPAMMLYNRAMGNGGKMFCPSIFSGAVYDEDEIETEPAGRVDSKSLRETPAEEECPFTDAPIPEMWTPKGEEVANLFGDRMTDEEIANHIPNGSSAGVDEEAGWTDKISSKQIGFLRGLLAERGVLEGDKTRLIHAVLGEDASREAASGAIEGIKNMNGLPAKWINAYVASLRERGGIEKSLVVDYLREVCNADKPAGLTRTQQVELINWLTSDSERKDDSESVVAAGRDDGADGTGEPGLPALPRAPLTESEMAWSDLIQSVVTTSGADYFFVEGYLASRCNPVVNDLFDASDDDLRRFQEWDRDNMVASIKNAYERMVGTVEGGGVL